VRLLLLMIIVYLAYRAVKSWVLRNLQVPGQDEHRRRGPVKSPDQYFPFVTEGRPCVILV
jgi:hypothetical protein